MEHKYSLNPKQETELLFSQISKYTPKSTNRKCKREIEFYLTDLFGKMKINEHDNTVHYNVDLQYKIDSALSASRFEGLDPNEFFEECDSEHDPTLTKEKLDYKLNKIVNEKLYSFQKKSKLNKNFTYK